MYIKPFIFNFKNSDQKIDFPGFDVPNKNIAILTGDNGSGKTTFLNFIRSHSDYIDLKNIPVKCLMLEQLYDYLIYPYKPIWWNISLPKIIKEKISKHEAIEIAQFQLKKFGLKLELNKSPETLSGGEKHLLLISRFSLSDHNILLLDEPTTAIDKTRENIFWEIMIQINKEDNKKIILSTHGDVLLNNINNKYCIFQGFHNKNLKIQNYEAI